MFFRKEKYVNLSEKGNLVQELYDDVERLIFTTEYGVSRLKGVGNLSRADLDSVKLYVETLIRNGGCGFSPLMEPDENVEKLFKAYRIFED